MRFLPGQIRLYSDQSFPGGIPADMGLGVPEDAVGQDTFLEISPELVTKAQADYLYVSAFGAAENTVTTWRT